jgi:cytochrome b561
MAIGLAGAFCVGLYMADLKFSPTRVRLFNWHKWAGITLLALAVLRLLWRLGHRPPPEPPMSALKQRLAAAAHWLLYLLFFLVPLAGWSYSSAAGFPVVWFGKIPLPDFVPVDKALAEQLQDVHAALAYTLAGVVTLHVAAALQHQFFERDSLLLRMMPARRRASEEGGS